MNEEWRNISAWPDYWVSNMGQVKGPKGLLKPTVKKQTKYPAVMLHRKCGKPRKERKQYSVHSLVLEAFRGPRPKGMMGCHNNGNPMDNRLENLRWDTAKANAQDAVKHGTAGIGEKNYRAKLREEDVRYILTCNENQPALARRFGVSQVKISQIRLRKAWKHVQVSEAA